MPSLFLIVPGRLEGRTGGYEYDRRMADGLRDRGWTVHVRELPGPYPSPRAGDLEFARGVLAAIPDRAVVLVDGLAYGALPAEVEHESARLHFVPIVHMRLGREAGLDPTVAARRDAAERRALAAARLIVVTGERTADALARSGVARGPIALVEPGTDPAPLARGSGGAEVHMLCVATLNAGKGHRVLFDALTRVGGRLWRLTCAGSTDRDLATALSLRETMCRRELEGRVTLVGELGAQALDEAYDRADLFVLATLGETYGMAVAEAIARGLPVVGTTTGAIPKIVGTEAGLLVPPGDVNALAQALSRVLTDSRLRARLAAGAREARSRLRSWAQAVYELEETILTVEPGT